MRVGQDTRLNNRVLDLRTPANQAIFRVQSQVSTVSILPWFLSNCVNVHHVGAMIAVVTFLFISSPTQALGSKLRCGLEWTTALPTVPAGRGLCGASHTKVVSWGK